MANTYKSKYTETSAALNHNVDELLVGILTQIRLKLQTQVKVRFNFSHFQLTWKRHLEEDDLNTHYC